ncbi:MAG: arginine deiminase-related protein, partial [Bacteroidota bacterium]
MQTTSHLLMIRPVNFSFNAETAVNNAFQSAASDEGTQAKALAEFEGLVKVLRDHQIDVTVINDTPEPYTPDSIFPNNWVSFHQGGVICLYPMYATNRRL